MTSESAPVVKAVEQAITTILGAKPEMVVSPGTYDQKHIDRIGKLEDCIAYGPGILTLAHQADEYVNVSDMVDSACVMGFALDNLLHGKNNEST
jgi:succinyl-diaminopimelate desuccinylase